VVVPQVKIALALSSTSTLPPAEKAALANGFPGATVTLRDAAGKIINATPEPAAPNSDFIVTSLNEGTYTVKAAWSGQPIAGSPVRILNGSWTGHITQTANVVTIAL
jgi:hypothetical protein